MSVTTQKRSISFSAPDVGEAEAREAREAILSGWITTGPRTKELERKIAKWIGVEKAACLSSQTACAETALRLLGIGVAAGGSADDEVITCAYTYTASASVIAHVGAKIVLVDCQRDSFLINYDAIEKAITSQTKAIIPVDIGGVVCDYDRLFEIVERKRNIFFSRQTVCRKQSEELQSAQMRLMHSALYGIERWLGQFLILLHSRTML